MEALPAQQQRPSSPHTPEPAEDPLAALNKLDLSAWCSSLAVDADNSWAFSEDNVDPKRYEENMVRLDEIIRETLLDPNPTEMPTSIDPVVFQRPQQFHNTHVSESSTPALSFSSDSSGEGGSSPEMLLSASLPTTSVTKAVPPPPARLRKFDFTATSQRVVYPPRESCLDLPIMTPSIPPTGTKSRVETQTRVTLDLAHASCSSGDPYKYDRVGSWKWLKLPQGTATRRRSRKEGRVDASPEDTLFLSAEVTCYSAPQKRVTSCSTCQGREAKRVARKIAARIRPQRSDSESNDVPSGREAEDSSNVIQFNCPDTLDFSGGSVVLPLRITCYCRHHREKVGFNVHFTMTDHLGRVVGRGMSPPIMITDDHKSTGINTKLPPNSITAFVSPVPSAEFTLEPQQLITAAPAPINMETWDQGVPAKRRSSAVAQPKKRSKPYDGARFGFRKFDLKSSFASGSSEPRQLTPPQSTPSSAASTASSFSISSSSHTSSPFTAIFSDVEAECQTAPLPSPPVSFGSPASTSQYLENTTDSVMYSPGQHRRPVFPLSPPMTAPSTPPSSAGMLSASHSPASIALPLALSQSGRRDSFPSLLLPRIHRLIPSSGPTHGGIEVTVLGSNFHPSILYNCVFGDVMATSTSRWSDNTLVCILPPRAVPGAVCVSLEGIIAEDECTQPTIFTYTDDSDRALMELALQVIGLKMTGKIDDPKNIALRIMGNSGQDGQSDLGSVFTGSVASSSHANFEGRRLLYSRGTDSDFEKVLIDSLSVIDVPVDAPSNSVSLSAAFSHQTSSGQTLLHLAAFLNLPSLVQFIIEHDADPNMRDTNGLTPLHFAALARSQACVRILLNAGVEIDAVDRLNRRALDIFSDAFDLPISPVAVSSRDRESDSEEEAWGDVDDSDAEDLVPKNRTRRPRSRRSSKPPSEAAHESEQEQEPVEELALDDDDNKTIVSPESPIDFDSQTKDKAGAGALDEKQAASFAAYLQRAWAQFQPFNAPNFGGLPQMPTLAMPQFPNLPAATRVFPILVPMPASFLRDAHKGKTVDGEDVEDDVAAAKTQIREDDAAQEARTQWSASWEKWMAQMSLAAAKSTKVSTVEKQPATKESFVPALQVEAETATAEAVVPSRSPPRQFGHGPSASVEREAKSYVYSSKRKQKSKRKEDRMLILFWIPILIAALAWAFYTGFPVLLAHLAQFKDIFPSKDVLRKAILN